MWASQSNNNEIESAIAARVETYRLGFLHLDPEQLISVWDSRYEPLVYVAQEMEDPIYGWAAIQCYYAALPEHLDAVLEKHIEEVKIDVLGDIPGRCQCSCLGICFWVFAFPGLPAMTGWFIEL